MVSLYLVLSIEIVLSSETSWLRRNYSWLNPMQIFYHSVVCTKPWKCRSCQFPSSSALSLTDNAVVSMSGFWGIHQKCCKIYLWNNLPTGKVLPYQFHWACAFLYSLIFTIELWLFSLSVYMSNAVTDNDTLGDLRGKLCAGREGRKIISVYQRTSSWMWHPVPCHCWGRLLLPWSWGEVGFSEGHGHTFSSLSLCAQGWSQRTWKAGLNRQPETSQTKLFVHCLFCEWKVSGL